MKAANFGQLVRELRKTTSDPHGNRWTRETLSKQIHLSVDQFGRLERGDRKYFDHQTLSLLANIFRLTPVERKEFLMVAAGITDIDIVYDITPGEQLSRLIDVVGDLLAPAFILDAFQDVIAINNTCRNLFLINNDVIDYSQQQAAGFNLLYYLYSPDLGFKDLIGQTWKEIAIVQIHQLRRTSFRFRHERYYKILFDTLFKIPQFSIDWYTSHKLDLDYYVEYEHFAYDHPFHGPLSYIATETNITTKHGELQLIIYNPTNTETTTVFKELTGHGRIKPTRLASWPDKNI